MIFNIFIIIASLSFLIIIHELGHFLIAKRLRIKVEEFGLGYPPRIIGKRIGETVYSLNLIPFGGFVRILGEEGEERKEEARNFFYRPYWQKALVVLGGVLAFWLMSWPLFSSALYLGSPVAVSDQEKVASAQVRILEVAPDSPAEKNGIKSGDIIREVVFFDEKNRNFKKERIEKVSQFQKIIGEYRGERVRIVIERNGRLRTIEIVPRKNPPQGQGAIGVTIARVTEMKYPLVLSLRKGAERVYYSTLAVVDSLRILTATIFDKELRKTVQSQVVGPIGIGAILNQSLNWGIGFYLNFIGLLAVYLAVFNILPIPALDGGKLLFLTIEKIRGKPFNRELEHKITTLFFVLLVSLIFIISIKDIQRFIL